MSLFRVSIEGGRASATYWIHEDALDSTAALAAQEALATWARHGHGTFPYEGGPLRVRVDEVEKSA